MTAYFMAVFAASVAGSLHCVGMCGGLVAWCTGLDGAAVQHRWRTTAAYHGGRFVTYTVLGGLAGGLGAAVDLGASQVGMSRVAAFVAGGLMILLGLTTLCGRGAVGLRATAPLPGRLKSVFKRGFDAAFDRGPVARAGIVGLLTGLLPCGWLYAFLLAAAGTGNVFVGAATMSVFWAGSVPALVAVGIGAAALTARVRRFAPAATALSLLVIGTLTIFGRVSLPAYGGEVPEVAQVSAETIGMTKPACCDEHD